MQVKRKMRDCEKKNLDEERQNDQSYFNYGEH